jgi:uncharacterized protein involved in exopolysaccharide biosynthesis
MPSTDNEALNPRQPNLLGRTIRHRWWAVLACWLLVGVPLGRWAYSHFPPTYRAFALLRADPQVTDLFGVRAKGETMEPFLQTQVQLLTSPNVLTAAGTTPKVASLERIQKAGDVVQELRKAISVSVIPGTYLIEVSMTSADPVECATLVNAVTDAYMEANNEWSDGMTRVQIRNLEAYDAELKNQTDELERKWKALAANGDADVATAERKKDDGSAANDANPPLSITMQEYREASRQLNDVKYELVQAEARLTEAKAAASHMGKAAGTTDEKAMIEEQIKRRFQVDPEAAELRNKLTDADLELKRLLRISNTDADPALKAAQRKMDALKAKWEQLWDIKSAAIREQIEMAGGAKGLDPAAEVNEAATLVNKLKAKLAGLKQASLEQTSLKQDLGRLEVKRNRQAVDAVQIVLIQDERKTLRELQEAVIKRLEQLRYEAKGEARIRPVNPNGATVPGKPISDHRPLAMNLVAFGSLMVVFAGFVGFEACFGPRLVPTKVEPPAEG